MSETVDIKAINRDVVQQFRANGGRVLEGRFAGSRLLLLTTKVAKSGNERVNPMMYATPGGETVVFASKNAAPNNPDWYHNLVAHPDVMVEIGDERYTATAFVTQGAERERLWAESVRAFPFLADMQAKTKRQIPLVKLVRKG
ncbi:MAG TPA: nitroreductase/quinone reductase family protein [Dehalococcoidia bacterium]|nr:nitroreductase/quinone reductase family protein [Dehalococcoidia bacterium]